MEKKKAKGRTPKATPKAIKKTVTTVTTTTTTVTTAPRVLKNRIVIVLDASTSMGPMRSEVIQGFNKQIETILKNNKDMDTKVSLLTFQTVVDPFRIFNQPVESLRPITEGDYITGGWTALYDAMGMAIESLERLPEANDPDCSFLVFTMTDGEENRSQRHTFHSITAKIKEKEATGRWTFSYLGANEGLKDVGTNLGMSWSNTFTGASLRMPGAYSNVVVASSANYMAARAKGMGATMDMMSFGTDPALAGAGQTGSPTQPLGGGTLFVPGQPVVTSPDKLSPAADPEKKEPKTKAGA